MKKPETPEQTEKRHQREAREIQKWERVQSRPLPARYFAILIVVLTVIYCVDEITSSINSIMQPDVIFDLFKITSRDANSPEYISSLNQLTIASYATYLFMFLCPFYKALSDKYGRRLFLAINTCIFGIGLLVVMVAPNMWIYLIGVVMLSFVTPNDLQVMYIMETAPKQHRAKLCFITKAIALMSVSLIGVFRTVFYNSGSGLSWWRNVYFIPVIAAVFVGAMSVFFTRETPVFMESRLSYLRSTDGERAAKALADKAAAENQNGGVFKAIKFMFSHKQIKAVTIAALLFSGAAGFTMTYSTVIAQSYGSELSTEVLNRATIIFPFANGIITIIAGFISDRLGRKKCCVITGTFSMTMLLLFIFSCMFRWGAVAVGIFYGAAIGGLWSMSDTLFLTMPGESVPTNLRASVLGIMTFMLMGMMVSYVLVIVLANFGLSFATGTLITTVPFMAVSLLILITKVHETKDVDLDTVTGLEWD